MLFSVVFYSLIISFCFSLRLTGDKRLVTQYNSEGNFDKWKVNITQKIFIKKSSRNGKKSSKSTHRVVNSVYADGIAHLEIKKQNKDWKKIKQIEKWFKNLLVMKGVKFIYKRDMFWRTWRDVSYSNNSKRIIFYKCSHIINTVCSGCFGGGFWIIEEDQIPCPYEIFSMVNKNQICVANYTQMDKIHKKCPSVATLNDLVLSCGNPIKTMYRVTITLSDLTSKRTQTDICRGREYCVISTFYRIYEDYINFRILDSSNEIIYSKIMKPDKKNYACVTKCGRLDPVTNIVSKSGEKRKNPEANKNDRPWKKNDDKTIHPFRLAKNRRDYPSSHLVTTTAPCCRKLQPTTEDYDEENYDYNISEDN